MEQRGLELAELAGDARDANLRTGVRTCELEPANLRTCEPANLRTLEPPCEPPERAVEPPELDMELVQTRTGAPYFRQIRF